MDSAKIAALANAATQKLDTAKTVGTVLLAGIAGYYVIKTLNAGREALEDAGGAIGDFIAPAFTPDIVPSTIRMHSGFFKSGTYQLTPERAVFMRQHFPTFYGQAFYLDELKPEFFNYIGEYLPQEQQ